MSVFFRNELYFQTYKQYYTNIMNLNRLMLKNEKGENLINILLMTYCTNHSWWLLHYMKLAIVHGTTQPQPAQYTLQDKIYD